MNTIKNPNESEHPNLYGLSWIISPGIEFHIGWNHVAPKFLVRLGCLAGDSPANRCSGA